MLRPTMSGCARVAVLALLGSLARPADAGLRRADADLILVNGHIITVDGRDTVAAALAVRAGRIVAVGTNAEVRALAAAGARVIDLKGRTATPGLIDSHAHIAAGGESAVFDIELSDAKSIAEIKRRVAARVARTKPGEWIVGSGWDEGKLAESRYVKASDLDAVAPRNPVWLEHTTGHYGTANSAALTLVHIDASTPNPPAGTIDHDAGGQPTGVLKEGAKDVLTAAIPPPTAAQWRQGILASLDLMHREGMTGVKDPDISQPEWDAYEALAREGKLTAHVCVLWHSGLSTEAVNSMIAHLKALPRPPNAVYDNLVSCGVKFFMDGSGAGRTAWVYEDWYKQFTEVDTGNKGYPLIDPDQYRAAVGLYNAAGVHVSTHAVGDRAIDWVVDTYAKVLAADPKPGLRHGIIHANFPTEHALEVMADLQKRFDAGYPETQPPFTWWIGDNYAANLGPKRIGRLNPYHTYQSRGILWAAGSDYPVTPLAARDGLWASVARTTARGTWGPQPFGTAEAVDIGTALKSYTIWAAAQLFLEHDSGSLEPGKSADIAVWDRDPTAVPTAAVKDMKCELTLFRGAVVYRAKGSPVTVSPARARAASRT